MFPMNGNRGGPGGSVAVRQDLSWNLAVMKTSKHDVIKQKSKNVAFSEVISI